MQIKKNYWWNHVAPGPCTQYKQYVKHQKNHLHSWCPPPSLRSDRRSRSGRKPPRGGGAGASGPAGGRRRPADRPSSGAPTAGPRPSGPLVAATPPGSTAWKPGSRRASPARLPPARSPGTPAPCWAGTGRRRAGRRGGRVWSETGSDACWDPPGWCWCILRPGFVYLRR